MRVRLTLVGVVVAAVIVVVVVVVVVVVAAAAAAASIIIHYNQNFLFLAPSALPPCARATRVRGRWHLAEAALVLVAPHGERDEGVGHIPLQNRDRRIQCLADGA